MTQTKVLLIEDESGIRDLYQMILESAGYKVDCASDGKQGLELAQKNHPDLILLDLMMPVMGGEETIKHLRTKAWGKNIPIIVLTNIGAKEVSKEIIDKNIKDILVKVELTPDQLVEKIQQTLNS